MGGSSKSSQLKTTKVRTTTTTTMRDVGLTGQNAVDMAAVLESGAIARTELTTGVLNNLVQASGAGYQRLVGGASDLVKTAESASKNLVSQAGALSREIQSPGQSDMTKVVLILSAAAIGGVVLMRKFK